MPRTSTTLLVLMAAVASASTFGCSRTGSTPLRTLPTPTTTPTSYAGKLLGSLDQTYIERTRGDMIAIRSAISNYMAGAGELPDATDFAALEGVLVPTYIHVLPRTDGWGSALRFDRGAGGADSWTLTAPGADGQVGTGDDVVLSDRAWTKVPDAFRNYFER